MNLEPAPRIGPATPRPGDAIEVATGVLWLRFPLPFALNHVNLWALTDGDGWTIVDTGFGDARSQAVWRELLDGPLAARPVRRIVVTHFHPDHMGLAGWLVERTGAAFHMPETEWLMSRYLFGNRGDNALATAHQFYVRAGLDPDVIAALDRDGLVYPRRITPPPATFAPLREGDVLAIGERHWQVIIGEGHAPAQACLWSAADELLIAADQILPRISPNVPVWPQAPDNDPLARYIASLKRFHELPATTHALPSHDWPFSDLHGRIDGLVRHHDMRLDESVDAVGIGACASTVLQALFPAVQDLHQLRFALGETLAHLNRLVAAGRLERGLEGEAWRYAPRR